MAQSFPHSGTEAGTEDILPRDVAFRGATPAPQRTPASALQNLLGAKNYQEDSAHPKENESQLTLRPKDLRLGLHVAETRPVIDVKATEVTVSACAVPGRTEHRGRTDLHMDTCEP